MKVISSNFFNKNKPLISQEFISRPSINHDSIISTEMLKKINSFLFSGIYQIESVITDEILYIGSSSNISKRLHQHITGIINRSNATHPDIIKHCDKYGIGDLNFDILEKVEITEEDDIGLELKMFQRLQYYLDTYEPAFNPPRKRVNTYSNKRYTKDTVITDIYINKTALNDFGNPIVNSFSLDHKTGFVKAKIGDAVDEERKNWTPTVVTFDEYGEPHMKVGDKINLKIKLPKVEIQVKETVVIRPALFSKK